MSVICSSHALVELEDLNYRLSMWCYGLSLLEAVPDEERQNEWSTLLRVCIEGVAETVAGIQAFEAGIRVRFCGCGRRACSTPSGGGGGPSSPPALT